MQEIRTSGRLLDYGGILKMPSNPHMQHLKSLLDNYSSEPEYKWAEFIGIFTAFIKVVTKKCADPEVLVELIKSKGKLSITEVSILIMDVIKRNTEEAKKQRPMVRDILKGDSLYLEAAYIAKDVYSKHNGRLLGGWTRCDEFPMITYWDKDETGLVSALYRRISKSKTEYIYATAGTDPISPRDWQNNLYQICGDSYQYDLALKNAITLYEQINKKGGSLMFVGHSLGGGLATNNALATNCRAVVFNPSGLSKETKTKNKIVASNHNGSKLVEVILSDNDILNLLQDMAQEFPAFKKIVPASEGTRYYLKTSSIMPFSHSMDGIIDMMERMR